MRFELGGEPCRVFGPFGFTGDAKLCPGEREPDPGAQRRFISGEEHAALSGRIVNQGGRLIAQSIDRSLPRGKQPDPFVARSQIPSDSKKAPLGLPARTASLLDSEIMEVTAQRMKPRLRGVFHELGFYVALGLGVVLVVTAEDGRARAAAAVFAGRRGDHRSGRGSRASTTQVSTCSSPVRTRRSGCSSCPKAGPRPS